MKKKVKTLTKLFQVINVKYDHVIRTFRTEEARNNWLSSEELAEDLSDVMSYTTFTTREIWTNMKEEEIKKLCKE